MGVTSASSQPADAAIHARPTVVGLSRAAAIAMLWSAVHSIRNGSTAAAMLNRTMLRARGRPGSRSSTRAASAGASSTPNNSAVGVASVTMAPHSRPWSQTRECCRGARVVFG